MTDAVPTIHGAPTVDIELPKVKNVASVLVSFGCLVMIGFMCWLAWRSDQRMVAADRELRQFREKVSEKLPAEYSSNANGRSFATGFASNDDANNAEAV